MYITWLLLAGIFLVLSIVSQLLLGSFRLRTIILVACGLLLYQSMRDILNAHRIVLSAKETTLMNPLLLGVCTCILITFMPQPKSTYTITHFDGWLPLTIIIIFYSLLALIIQDLFLYAPWLIGGIFILYSSTRYRNAWYALLLCGLVLFLLSWNSKVTIHGFLAGSIVIFITIVIFYFDQRQQNKLLYKQLGLAGILFISASKVNPLGGAWLLSFIKTPETNENLKHTFITSIEGVAFCTLGWLLSPFVITLGISSIHLIELFFSFLVFLFIIAVLFFIRNFTNLKSGLPEFKTLIQTDEITTLTAGYLVCTGNFPIILFVLVFILYIINLFMQESTVKKQLTVKPVAIVGNNDETPAILQSLHLFSTITEPLLLFAEYKNKETENLLASTMANLIRAGYSVIPQNTEPEACTVLEVNNDDALPILVSANSDIYKKLPVLVKKYFVVMTYKTIPSEETFTKITLVGSSERAGKNSFSSCAPLIQTLYCNNKYKITQIITIDSQTSKSMLKNLGTGITYTYISRTELQSLKKLIAPQSIVLVLCDESPGWPPADFRIPELISETHPCFLVFPRTITHNLTDNQYPELVELCIKENRIVTFGEDSAIADAIKVLLAEVFKDIPKEIDSMASLFYPKAFLEPIMLDSGIMLLHARNKTLSAPTLAIALSSKGWQHLTQKHPVHCILMLISPETISAQEHLDNLSALVHAIRDMNLIQTIMEETFHKH